MKHLKIMKTEKKDLVAGVIALHSLHDSFSEECLYGSDAIDLTYLEAETDLEAQGKTEEEIEEEMEDFEADSVTILFGDWKLNKEGKYEIDYDGKNGFAGTYSNYMGAIATLDWSKHSARCNKTSPCYVMTDGRPCGDLDTKGDDVEAYCFPEDYYRGHPLW